MSLASATPSLTPSRSSSPTPPVQPDHFYGANPDRLPLSPDSDGKTWLDPEDDPLAHRGIPVFKPTMEEFVDFEGYMNKIECWGAKSGIVKVIPPKEWTEALPPLKEQLAHVKIKTPIEQHMLGRGGLFRQENVEKRRNLSVREWAELCSKDDFRAPGVDEVDLHARGTQSKPKQVRRARKKDDHSKIEDTEQGTGGISIKEEAVDANSISFPLDDTFTSVAHHFVSPPTSVAASGSPPSYSTERNSTANVHLGHTDDPGESSDQQDDIQLLSPQCVADDTDKVDDEKPAVKARRNYQTREAKEASLAERAARDEAFLETFNPHLDWLPPNTTQADYTSEFCQKLERQYWRNCGLARPAWYGADTQGSLYKDETKVWNVAHLPSLLSRILPASSKGLPGVNTPYLYFGMWRATFAWHVEDMDLFSINYIHFGAPKFWYATPQGRAGALEQTMKGYFPKDPFQCPQFLRHKSFLASPTLLAQSSCRPNTLVQYAGEFVITYPRGYHAGFNLGFNCAESVNFALDSWLELGRKAKACQCISDSVRIDVDQLLRDREAERNASGALSGDKMGQRFTKPDDKRKPPRKRKAENDVMLSKAKRAKTKGGQGDGISASPSSSKVTVTLKLGPKPPELDQFPCCLCVSSSREGLLRVQDAPVGRKDLPESLSCLVNRDQWNAHEECASVVPETWVDELEVGLNEDGTSRKVKVIFGVDAIVKDRWHLKCSACSKSRYKAHGAPIQCTKGKCAKSFHVSCARNGHDAGILYSILRCVEKEVVLVDPFPPAKKIDSVQLPPEVSSSFIESDMTVDHSFSKVGETEVNGSNSHIDPLVLKVIKKLEVQVLCSQHNPSVAAAKRASKQDKIRTELLALPTMTRIKVRVSAGVFEVSLLRVIEEAKSIEVLWDRGLKREFKWGSVVFGQTEGQNIQQKPSEPAPDFNASLPATGPFSSAATAFPSMVTAAKANSLATVPVSNPSILSRHTQTLPGSSNYSYISGSWPYRYQAQPLKSSPIHPQPFQQNVSYAYPGYYHAPTASAPYPQYHIYANSSNNLRSQLQWQKPYTGPRTYDLPVLSTHHISASAVETKANDQSLSSQS